MRCALVFVGALGLAVAPAAAASAHSQEIGTSPATRVVARLPLAVSVTFDKPLRATGFLMTVIGRDGLDYGTGTPTVYHSTTLRRDVRVGSPNGPYTINWVMVSADGHQQTGSFGFVAAHGNAAFAPTGAPSESARAAASAVPSVAASATPPASPSAAPSSAAPSSATPSSATSASSSDGFIQTSPGPFTPRTDPRADGGLRGALGEPSSTEDDGSSRSLFTYLPLGLGAVLVVAAGLVSLVTRRRNAAVESEQDRSPLSR